MRPIAGRFNAYDYQAVHADGVLFTENWLAYDIKTGGSNLIFKQFNFNSANLGEAYNGADTHPRNMAVRYLIRALP
jgi:hypothetical protein